MRDIDFLNLARVLMRVQGNCSVLVDDSGESSDKKANQGIWPRLTLRLDD